MPVLNAAYNYPARVTTRCPWNVFFDASFIFWQPIQENMELAVVNTTPLSAGGLLQSDTLGGTGLDFYLVNMKFKYKPGFKVGLGGNFDYDNWDVHAEYTWFHNTQRQSTGTPAVGQLLPTWGVPQDFAGAPVVAVAPLAQSASEKWRLGMDLIDLVMGRWCYMGTKLVIHPFSGARAAFIRQKANLSYGSNGAFTTATGATTLLQGAGTFSVKEVSHSWAIGPEIGIDANWNLGSGFRLLGTAEYDLLFTKYTKLYLAQNWTPLAGVNTTASLPGPIYAHQSKYIALRSHIDLEMGLGWGTYIDCNNWYLDFAATYGFQVFFDQNMFRFWAQDPIYGARTISPHGNLYVQGLTVTARLDF